MNNTTTLENLAHLKRQDFQTKIDDKQTDLFILRNKLGMEVAVSNYGGAVLAIMVPDRDGKVSNVVLSHSDIKSLVNSPEPFLSTTIGRYANRICKGEFTLNGDTYKLATNNGPNHLHGGPTGFHARVWDAEQTDEKTVVMKYQSQDMEEGFPGTLDVKITYSLSEEANAFIIEYEATTDKTTIVNLTNHGFFNLAGVANPTPSIEDNIVEINASFYTPIDSTSIPTGEIATVSGTPMDFRTPQVVGDRIDADFEQLQFGAGYDHNYVLDKGQWGELSYAASCKDPKSGRIMEVYTTEPGVQLYTGNWLNGFSGSHGATFPKRSAICFEAQCFPDTPNKGYFPSAVLTPEGVYEQTTIYNFYTDADEEEEDM